MLNHALLALYHLPMPAFLLVMLLAILSALWIRLQMIKLGVAIAEYQHRRELAQLAEEGAELAPLGGWPLPAREPLPEGLRPCLPFSTFATVQLENGQQMRHGTPLEYCGDTSKHYTLLDFGVLTGRLRDFVQERVSYPNAISELDGQVAIYMLEGHPDVLFVRLLAEFPDRMKPRMETAE